MSRTSKPKAVKPAADLREACVVAAHAVIAQHGVEKLSLRDVARRLGVSHQAPYKHYPTRDHLLAEVMRRCFEDFALFLDATQGSASAQDDMQAMGEAYLAYAIENPLQYRLMFGTPWPSAVEHPALLQDAQHSFLVLRRAIARMRGRTAITAQDDLDALFVWSSMHGLATILQSNVIERLALGRGVLQRAVPHTLERVGLALACAPGLLPTPSQLPAKKRTRRKPA